jgi:hypothetical protein
MVQAAGQQAEIGRIELGAAPLDATSGRPSVAVAKRTGGLEQLLKNKQKAAG